MGNEQTTDKKPLKPIDKNQLDIQIKQIFYTAQLNKDRRRGQQVTREKELLALVRQPANKRAKDNEYQKAAALVNDAKWIKAHELVMRYADILKDNIMVIELSKGYTLENPSNNLFIIVIPVKLMTCSLMSKVLSTDAKN